MTHTIVTPTVTLDAVRNKVDHILVSYFEEKISAADKISSSYGDLWRSIEALNQSGGKRLRPYMTILAYEALRKNEHSDDAYNAAAAQELMHLSMLIHDDIIDRDVIRYGVRNISGHYDDLYAPYIKSSSERRHFANSAALLAGDLLISSSYELAGRSALDGGTIYTLQQILSDAFFAVAGGELIDTETAFRPDPLTRASTIAEYKTASYSFISPLCSGAALAGVDHESMASLKRFGQALGIAFQVQDDILGVFGDEAQTGKSTVSDIREGKRTQLIELFEEHATEEQKETFFGIFHNHRADDAMVREARHLLEASGTRDRAMDYIADLCARATRELDSLPLNEGFRTSFEELIEICTQRSK